MTFERVLHQSTPVPVPYVRRFNFTDWQASHPSDPPPGTALDAEFNAVQTSLTATQNRLAQIQNDDGSLANGAVGLDQLTADMLATVSGGFNPRGAWQANTAYAMADAVNMDGILWACVLDHTSTGNFAADRLAGDWMFIDQPIAARSVPCDPIAPAQVNNVQQALDYLVTELQNLSARVTALENAP